MPSLSTRSLIGWAAVGALALSACSSAEGSPDALAMTDEATTTVVTEAPDDPVIFGPVSFEDLTDDELALLQECADAVGLVTESFDENSPTYESDVLGEVMAADSPVFDVCGPLLEGDSAIPSDVVIGFMIQQLPPELITVLGGAVDPELLDDAGVDALDDSPESESVSEPESDDGVPG